jgi:hypothetical protein
MSAKGLKLGDWYICCDICGDRIWGSEARVQWDNAVTCATCYTERHPQDFLAINPENRSPPIVRPVPYGTAIEDPGTLPENWYELPS